jgi:hypothetical protein
VQAYYRQTLARNGGCCKQLVRAPVRDFVGRCVSCAVAAPVALQEVLVCRMLSGVLPRRCHMNAMGVYACVRNERPAVVREHAYAFAVEWIAQLAFCVPLSIG